jgi:ABC-type multidrug transport system ATPase subunit/ABC-type multidrug transport system permease subunit
MDWAIETYQLTKRFPQSRGWRSLFSRRIGQPVVNSVNLKVAYGELFGLVGPNGAGKTTLIKMLTTLILPTSGSAYVNGYSLREDTAIKGTIGLVTSDERSFYWRLTGRQNLEFFASLHAMSTQQAQAQINEILELVGLENEGDKPFQNYSTGMRQRLSIGRALLSQPKLLFLDEPTKGLDLTATKQLHTLVRDKLTRQHGITIFMTSHNLEEVERLCDRVAVMNNGRIRACDTIKNLGGLIQSGENYHLRIREWRPEGKSLVERFGEDLEIHPLDNDIVDLHFKGFNDINQLNIVIDSIRGQGGIIESLTKETLALDQIFTHVVQDRSESVEQQPEQIQSPFLEGRETRFHPDTNSVKPVTFLKAAWAFLKRDLRSEMSYRVSFILQFVSVFFTVALFYFIAQMFSEATIPYLTNYGGDYFSFVLIGIAFAGYFGVGLSGFSSSLRTAQTTGTLEAMVSTPTRLSTIILCSSLWSYLMTTFRVLVYLALGGLLLNVDMGSGNYLAALVVIIFTVISFSSLGIIAAGFIMVIKRGNPITWAFGSASNLLGGIYYPIDVLPGWMQIISKFIPITYALRAMRLALLQGASFVDLLPDILVMVGFSVVLLPISLVVFSYAVRRARIEGSLTHY